MEMIMYWLFILLDKIVYTFVSLVVQAILYMADLNIFANADISRITSKLYIVLSIVMVLFLILGSIQVLLDPDKAKDVGGGSGKLVKNLIIASIMLLLVNQVFDFARDLQTYIIELIPEILLSNDNMKKIVDDDGKEKEIDIGLSEQGDNGQVVNNTNKIKQAGDEIALTTFVAFLEPKASVGKDIVSYCANGGWCNNGDRGWLCLMPANTEGGKTMTIDDCKNNSNCKCEQYYEKATGNLKKPSRIETALSDIVTYNTDTTGTDFFHVWTSINTIGYLGCWNDTEGWGIFNMWPIEQKFNAGYCVYHYRWLFSTIVGVFLLWTLFNILMQVGVRSIKLGILQITAPIPIGCYIYPKTKKHFDDWLKTCKDVYISLFIRIAVVYLIVFLFRMLITGGFFQATNISKLFPNCDKNGSCGAIEGMSFFFVIGIIVSIVLFAKEAPKFFEDAFGLKGAGSLKDVFKSPKQALKDLAGVAGAVLSPLTGAVARVGTGLITHPGQKWWKGIGRGVKDAIGGAMGGAVRGVKGAVKGSTWAEMKAAQDAAMGKYANAALKNQYEKEQRGKVSKLKEKVGELKKKMDALVGKQDIEGQTDAKIEKEKETLDKAYSENAEKMKQLSARQQYLKSKPAASLTDAEKKELKDNAVQLNNLASEQDKIKKRKEFLDSKAGRQEIREGVQRNFDIAEHEYDEFLNEKKKEWEEAEEKARTATGSDKKKAKAEAKKAKEVYESYKDKKKRTAAVNKIAAGIDQSVSGFKGNLEQLKSIDQQLEEGITTERKNELMSKKAEIDKQLARADLSDEEKAKLTAERSEIDKALTNPSLSEEERKNLLAKRDSLAKQVANGAYYVKKKKEISESQFELTEDWLEVDSDGNVAIDSVTGKPKVSKAKGTKVTAEDMLDHLLTQRENLRKQMVGAPAGVAQNIQSALNSLEEQITLCQSKVANNSEYSEEISAFEAYKKDREQLGRDMTNDGYEKLSEAIDDKNKNIAMAQQNAYNGVVHPMEEEYKRCQALASTITEITDKGLTFDPQKLDDDRKRKLFEEVAGEVTGKPYSLKDKNRKKLTSEDMSKIMNILQTRISQNDEAARQEAGRKAVEAVENDETVKSYRAELAQLNAQKARVEHVVSNQAIFEDVRGSIEISQSVSDASTNGANKYNIEVTEDAYARGVEEISKVQSEIDAKEFEINSNPSTRMAAVRRTVAAYTGGTVASSQTFSQISDLLKSSRSSLWTGEAMSKIEKYANYLVDEEGQPKVFHVEAYPGLSVTYPSLVQVEEMLRIGNIDENALRSMGLIKKVNGKDVTITDPSALKEIIDQVQKQGANQYVRQCMQTAGTVGYISNPTIVDGINHIRLTILNSNLDQTNKDQLLAELERDPGKFLQSASDKSSAYARISEELAQFERMKEQQKNDKNGSGK